jgi:hypothetical protein
MINANELRVGNIVSIGGHQHEVEIVGYGFIQLFGNLITSDPDDIEPVALTPEILEKAGFKDPHSDGCFLDYPVSSAQNSFLSVSVEYEEGEDNSSFLRWLLTNSEKKSDGTVVGRNVIWSDNKLKYVHQLQNLYFALTGEELIINL